MNTWQSFFEQFSLLNSKFIQAVSKTYPELTSMEFKLCCLLRAGYTNSQIAKITNRSLRAVETARYRMRKKLPIKTNDDLTVFLMKM